MIFYSDKNVYEAALERFRYIFREFYGKRKIVVTMSGGKDSTVVLNLAHEVMKEMGIEKIPVLFLDQEAETPMTIEYVRYIMHLPWVEPYWIQSYFQEWNASRGNGSMYGDQEKSGFVRRSQILMAIWKSLTISISPRPSTKYTECSSEKTI